MTEAAGRAAVLAEAVTWLGTHFAMGQASKGFGVDCGLFLAACYRAAGIDLPLGFGLFRHDWHLHTKEERYLAIIEAHAHQVIAPQPGDLVIVRLKSSQPFSHSGIVIAWPSIVHAAFVRGSGSVCRIDASHGPAARWETRFYSPWGA
jgi:cell wall-associated NlpC family hydrolase